MINLEVCSKSDKGRRNLNEDSLLVVRFDDLYLLAVADGLGGHAAGEVASNIAVTQIEAFMKVNIHRQNLQEAMIGAIQDTNREILSLSSRTPSYLGMGSTLVAAVVFDNQALISNVGDSRAYLVGSEITQITTDHSIVQQLVEQRVIGKNEAFNHPQRNIVTKTLGTRNMITPDFYTVKLSGRTLLLCSDGLSDILNDDQIRTTVAVSPDLDEACIRLIDAANAKGAQDNITVILAKGNY